MFEFLKKNVELLVAFVFFLFGIFLLFGYSSATLDDDFYLLETAIMSEAIAQGEWYGNYATGVHGFIFKLPVALVFLFTGPSIEIAVISNILIACLSLILFNKTLDAIFKNKGYALAGTIILMTNFQFLLHLPTYMREIPVVFTIILLMYAVVKRKSLWLQGLVLLLLFDAKELVFFMISPGLFLSILYSYWRGLNFLTIRGIFSACIKLFLPSLIYILLMIFTSLIPLNTVIFTVIPGITEGGVEFQLKHFELKAATQNIVRLKQPEAATVYTYIPFEESRENLFGRILTIISGYIGKVLYPRSFSYLSIPLAILIPTVFTSIALFRNQNLSKNQYWLTFSFLIWSFVTIFIARQSFDRYLFPITPVVVAILLLFMSTYIHKWEVYLSVVLVAYGLSLISLIFEADYVFIKFLLHTLLFITFISLPYLEKILRNGILTASIIISIITLGVTMFYFYASGIIYQYNLWGRNYEVDKVVSTLGKEDSILINDIGWDLLIGVYRGNRQYNPEWKWALKEWVPRKSQLKIFDKVNTYTMESETILDDRKMVERFNIKKIVLMKSLIPEKPFPFEKKLSEYFEAEWVELEKKVLLKNKEMYVFSVKE